MRWNASSVTLRVKSNQTEGGRPAIMSAAIVSAVSFT